MFPLVLYAETHYRFRYFFSYLRKSEPEIVADAPFRIEPEKDIPLLLLIKDSHQFPCVLLGVDVAIAQDGKNVSRQSLLPRPVVLQNKWWWRVYNIPRQQLHGWIEMNVTLAIEVAGEHRVFHNDNYRTSSREPLKIFLADSALPRLGGMALGDIHTHSNYTDDQVEYGAPVGAAATLAKALGLSFFAVSDHSYDLDDNLHNYLQNDSSLPKWHSLRKEVKKINQREKPFTILIGEEVSCRNRNGTNVHLLILGTKSFFHGSGDSAELWLRTRSESSIREILERIDPGIALAAHPLEPVPFLQKLLLRRGMWGNADLQNPNLLGMQLLNGDTGEGFIRGIQKWKELLLSGRRVLIFGGDDAHGNFNRFRQIRIPFFSIHENMQHLFGRMRTAVFLDKEPEETTILQALMKGASVVTDGPVGSLRAVDIYGKTIRSEKPIRCKSARFLLSGRSTAEFGIIQKILLFSGRLGGKHEDILFESDHQRLQFDITLPMEIRGRGYVRMEVHTSSSGTFDNHRHFCLTNPIWFVSPHD